MDKSKTSRYDTRVAAERNMAQPSPPRKELELKASSNLPSTSTPLPAFCNGAGNLSSNVECRHDIYRDYAGDSHGSTNSRPYTNAYTSLPDCEAGEASLVASRERADEAADVLSKPVQSNRRDSGYAEGGTNRLTDKKNDDVVVRVSEFRTDHRLRRRLVVWSCVGSFGMLVLVGFVLGTQVA